MAIEIPSGSCEESTSAAVYTPRLSIQHLLLWVLCSAAILGLTRGMYAGPSELPSGITIWQVSSVIQGVLAGAVLTGAIVLLRTRLQSGPPMLRQPGHWLLLISAALNAVYVPVVGLLMFLERAGMAASANVAVYGTIFLLPALGYALAARHNQFGRWQLLFIGLAAVALCEFVHLLVIGLSGGFNALLSVTSTLVTVGGLLLGLMVAAAALGDLVAGRRFDWLHWTGIATHLAAVGVTPLLWYAGSLLAR